MSNRIRPYASAGEGAARTIAADTARLGEPVERT